MTATTSAPVLADRRTRIMVADDHTLLRDALCELLVLEEDFTVCGVAGDGVELLDVAARTSPDVVLLDLDMPQHDPVRNVGLLRRSVPSAKIVVLTMHERRESVQALLGAGAAGFLSKSVGRQHLVSSIRSVRSGNAVTVAVTGGGAGPLTPAPETPLSDREIEVLTLVADALSNRQIGRRLCITEGTVKRHLRNAFGKLGATSRMDAVLKGRELGLFAPSHPYR